MASLLPAFIFRIDEITERGGVKERHDNHGRWVPQTTKGSSRKRSPDSASGGVSGLWWYFNGESIQLLPHKECPAGASFYKTFSMYYSGGWGFFTLEGDATNMPEDAAWLPLKFDHNEVNYSSTVSQTGAHATMLCHNPNTSWPSMLVPDIYHGSAYPHEGYGGLNGELPLFLGLVAFSMQPNYLRDVLPQMFQNGRWATHPLDNGRIHKRGVVVSVYQYNNNHEELEGLEEGERGNYYT